MTRLGQCSKRTRRVCAVSYLNQGRISNEDKNMNSIFLIIMILMIAGVFSVAASGVWELLPSIMILIV